MSISQIDIQVIGRTWRILGNVLLKVYPVLQEFFCVHFVATCLLLRSQVAS